ncbi:MAG: DUF1579 domain-containing protein [Thermoanaerobaculia bacterium]|nr:DUF1579 domain-containing protein [Thermoanaerobaculia bacterium]
MTDHRPIHPRWIVVAAVVALVSIAPLAAQQETVAEAPTMDEMMEAWMESAEPGEHHAHLAPFAGRWTAEISMWMEPGAEPSMSHAKTEAQWVLGGRYLEWIHAGEFAGMPFEGRQMDAYNNVEQRYESTWADNFGTPILYYMGHCEENGTVRTLHGEFTDPMSGQTVSQRAVYTWQDDDHWTYESYMAMGDGEEFKNMEIRYTRVTD